MTEWTVGVGIWGAFSHRRRKREFCRAGKKQQKESASVKLRGSGRTLNCGKYKRKKGKRVMPWRGWVRSID